MDILEIKKLINKWQKDINKGDNYTTISTIKEIIDVYKKLGEKQKGVFLENLRPLQKIIFDLFYSQDPFVRRSIVNLAYVLNSNELIHDIIRYLKIEKDYDNLLLYLKYLKKFRIIGFLPNLIEFAKETQVLVIKYSVFSVLLSLAPFYKNYQEIVKMVFNDFWSLINEGRNFIPLISVYEELTKTSLNHYQNKERAIIASFFYGFYNYFFIKSVELIDIILDKLGNTENEERNRLLSNIFVYIFISYLILEEGDYFRKEQFINKHQPEEGKEKKEIYRNYNLLEILKKIIYKSNNKGYILLNISNLIDEFKMKEEFKSICITKDFIDFLIKLLEPKNEKLSLQILNFIIFFDIKLTEEQLMVLEEFSKHVFNELVIDKCLDVFDKNDYLNPLFYFLKYVGSYSEKLKEKLKVLIKKAISRRIGNE